MCVYVCWCWGLGRGLRLSFLWRGFFYVAHSDGRSVYLVGGGCGGLRLSFLWRGFLYVAPSDG